MTDKFLLADKIKKAKPVNKELFIQDKCVNKTVLDLGCIRHCAEYALKDRNWLHKKIVSVAVKVVGVDYLPEEIKKLNSKGYNIIFGDVSKPLDINEKFDVIVAGDLIEHLTNFEGFFNNCKRLLKPGGILIISTPNPFFCGEFHYVSFRNNFVVNPEHTCWIDPQCLSQLSKRMGFRIEEIAYIKSSWALKGMICETKRHRYNILTGNWEPDTTAFKVKRIIIWHLFSFVYFLYKLIPGTNSVLCRHSDYLAVLKKEDAGNG